MAANTLAIPPPVPPYDHPDELVAVRMPCGRQSERAAQCSRAMIVRAVSPDALGSHFDVFEGLGV